MHSAYFYGLQQQVLHAQGNITDFELIHYSRLTIFINHTLLKGQALMTMNFDSKYGTILSVPLKVLITSFVISVIGSFKTVGRK